jgi:hypothetical protein
MIYFVKFLGSSFDLYSINKKEHILAFLDTKKKIQWQIRTKDGLEHGTITCSLEFLPSCKSWIQ